MSKIPGSTLNKDIADDNHRSTGSKTKSIKNRRSAETGSIQTRGKRIISFSFPSLSQLSIIYIISYYIVDLNIHNLKTWIWNRLQ